MKINSFFKKLAVTVLSFSMVFSVSPITAAAGTEVWNSSVKILEAKYKNQDGLPAMEVKYETVEGQVGCDICLLEPCVPGLPEKNLPRITYDGSEYYLSSYHTIDPSNSEQYVENSDGTTTVKTDSLYLFDGVTPTAGDTFGVVMEIQNTTESFYTDILEFTVPPVGEVVEVTRSEPEPDPEPQCEHEWENEKYVEDGGDHVRVCKLCGYVDLHKIDCDGSWINVSTEDECRYPCCRKCKQAVPDYPVDDISLLCHKVRIEANGSSDTHTAYCDRCGYVFTEKAPCYDPNDWFHSAADVIDEDEIDRIEAAYLHENGDGTATITCACGNQKTVDMKGKVIDTGHVDLNLNYNGHSGEGNVGYVNSLTQVLNDEDFSELVKTIEETESLKQELKEKLEAAGIDDVKNAVLTAETSSVNVDLVEAVKTEGEGDNAVQTAKVDISKSFRLTFTSGDRSFSMDGDFNVLVDQPTSICIPAPEGFGNDGDTVRVDHEHRGNNYVYYGKITTFPDQNGTPTKVVMWTSEKGLSPFKLTISKAVTEEYKNYLNGVASPGNGGSTVETVVMYRLYNPNSGEHFYTKSQREKDSLIKSGWDFEGEGWTAPTTGKPVYRLYNENAGDHHYTMSKREKDKLIEAGWKDEGIGWYSTADDSGKPLFRLYNPNATGAGSHHYTKSARERDKLIEQGWKDEKIAWYGM